MIERLVRGIALLRGAIERHGGGWKGICSVATRSLKVLHALGWNGFVQRIRTAHRRAARSVAPPAAAQFPKAEPIDRVTLDVGVMVHVFYPDLLAEIAGDLARMPLPFVLMASVMDDAAKSAALSRFRHLPQVRALHVRVVPNRGRDLAPLLLSFREEILALDVVCHIHTKKSLYTGSEQDRWRRYLVNALLGSERRIAWILGMFQAAPRLGMVYPESFSAVPLWAHTWLSNTACARELGRRLDIDIDPDAYIDFAVGSMFWARVDALRPLYELGLTLAMFPEEQGQTDGTLQHALERMLTLVTRRQQMLVGILPAHGRLTLATEGERNWETYFEASFRTKATLAAIDSRVVSFDIFDTLVLRPFLSPPGARAYLAHRVAREFGLNDFAVLRERAETKACAAAGRDVDCATIYEVLARMPQVRGLPVARIRELELETERHLLRPRTAVIDAAHQLGRAGKRVVAISDMSVGGNELRSVLPPSVAAALQHVYVSGETGWRKDTDEAWRHIPARENVPPRHWLHVGDNEHSDIQRPQALGFLTPVHVLRPRALLDVVPALRRLRPSADQRNRWQDQLWLGLVANRFSDLADTHPEAFGQDLTLENPETVGYTVLGPLILDYLTWLARLALDEGATKLLFLSREGYLLRRAYRVLQAAVPTLASVEGVYLLASRRGVGTPMLRDIEDVAHLLGSTFTGPLRDLLHARLGARVAAAAAARFGDTEVYLPAMRAQVIDMLRPDADRILGIAQAERETYLRYWADAVGDARSIVADLGYAGTIQTHLARLTGSTLGGAYFALKQDVDQTRLHAGWARARYYDERVDGDAHSPILHHGLMLEAVLTSPDGQFSHFETGPDGLRPIYLPNGPDPRSLPIIASIHQGAESFVRDACDVTGADALDLEFDRELVQEPLRCLGIGLWRPGSWIRALSTEDHYTGRGEVAAGID